MDGHCIGIVGGLGPYAGLDLVKKIFDNTIATHDQDHLRVMLHSFPGDIPVRPEFLLGQSKVNPGHMLGQIMVGLSQAGADLIAMPCNTAQSPSILDMALEKLRSQNQKCKFIHIIETAVAEVKQMAVGKARIGLMATVATLQTRLYQDALEKAGYQAVLLEEDECQAVQMAISHKEFGIKAGSNPVHPKAMEILLRAAELLVNKGIDLLLLGCTEIPLALTEKTYFGVSTIDATNTLAKALIRAYDPARLKD